MSVKFRCFVPSNGYILIICICLVIIRVEGLLLE